MIDDGTLKAILDGLKDEVVFVDTEHMIRYMNKAAIEFYKEGVALVGTSLLDCHNEESNKMILEMFDRVNIGEDEILFSQKEDPWIYFRAVRDSTGELLGYYERYTPPGDSEE